MTNQRLFVLAVLATFAVNSHAWGGSVQFQFSGGGVSGSGTLTYGPDPISGDPTGALAIIGISGSISDSNNGLNLQNEAITGLVAISPQNPPPQSPFPASISYYPVTGLPPGQGPALSYDNLFYPDSSPVVCPDYPGAGGYLDVYGVMFTLSNGYVVDLWSNGTFSGGPPLSYGLAVVDGSGKSADFVSDGIGSSVPEPTSLCMLASGLIGVMATRRRTVAALCVRAIPWR